MRTLRGFKKQRGNRDNEDAVTVTGYKRDSHGSGNRYSFKSSQVWKVRQDATVAAGGFGSSSNDRGDSKDVTVVVGNRYNNRNSGSTYITRDIGVVIGVITTACEACQQRLTVAQ